MSTWDKIKSYAGYPVHVKWQTKSDELANKKFDELGFKGNIGSRQKFTWMGKTYYLLEIQRCRDCWHQWRVVLCDDKMMPIKILPLKSSTGLSRSFANPNIYQRDNGDFFVSYFLPTEGNVPKEVGNLIYRFNSSVDSNTTEIGSSFSLTMEDIQDSESDIEYYYEDDEEKHVMDRAELEKYKQE